MTRRALFSLPFVGPLLRKVPVTRIAAIDRANRTITLSTSLDPLRAQSNPERHSYLFVTKSGKVYRPGLDGKCRLLPFQSLGEK